VPRLPKSLFYEDGADIGVTDALLASRYATPPESIDGSDVVVWCCLRVHHTPRFFGEEKLVVPYHFAELRLEPRDVLNDTIRNLHSTTPPSPI
jgi:Cu2+-containing amine oxidase